MCTIEAEGTFGRKTHQKLGTLIYLLVCYIFIRVHALMFGSSDCFTVSHKSPNWFYCRISVFPKYVYCVESMPCVSVLDQCGGNIRITSANYLTSPGYPASYLPSQRCVWVITAPAPHQRILINFNPHFDLEDRECK